MRPLVPLSLAALALSAAAAHASSLFEDLPLIGTSGGHSFTRMCSSGQVLTGVRWRVGAVVDGIGIVCSPIKADGSLGTPVNVGTMAGGNGGSPGSGGCGGGVIAAQNGATAGVSLGSLFFNCFLWSAAGRSYTGAIEHTITVRAGLLISASQSQCQRGDQPAVGIRGRHGSFIDAVGLVCGKP